MEDNEVKFHGQMSTKTLEKLKEVYEYEALKSKMELDHVVIVMSKFKFEEAAQNQFVWDFELMNYKNEGSIKWALFATHVNRMKFIFISTTGIDDDIVRSYSIYKN